MRKKEFPRREECVCIQVAKASSPATITSFATNRKRTQGRKDDAGPPRVDFSRRFPILSYLVNVADVSFFDSTDWVAFS
jgi:hypothetical protein